MKPEEVIVKSVSGAKWTIFLSTLGVPLGFATTIVLARISPEALGIYGLLAVLVTFTTTFILFGGINVLAKYLPEMEKRKQAFFLRSYAFVIYAFAAPIILIIYFYPQILATIFGQQIPQNFLNYFVVFVPIILLFSLLNYGLNGLLEIKTSSIIAQVLTFSNFLFFTFMYFFYRSFFSNNLWLIIFGFSILLYCFLILLQYLALEKKLRVSPSHAAEIEVKATRRHDDVIKQQGSISLSKLKLVKFSVPSFYLPVGFWSFVWFANLSTITFFIADRLDQLLAVHYFSISVLKC